MRAAPTPRRQASHPRPEFSHEMACSLGLCPGSVDSKDGVSTPYGLDDLPWALCPRFGVNTLHLVCSHWLRASNIHSGDSIELVESNQGGSRNDMRLCRFFSR